MPKSFLSLGVFKVMLPAVTDDPRDFSEWVETTDIFLAHVKSN